MPKTVSVSAPARGKLRTPDEAAEYLGFKVQTLAKWRSTGSVIIPFVKVGRLVRYRQSALDEYLARQEREHT